MNIYDNTKTMLREYYTEAGEFAAHMNVEMIDHLSKTTPEARANHREILDGWDCRPWGEFPDHPDNENTERV